MALHKTRDNAWHSVFTNNHGRKIYVQLVFTHEGLVNICDCFYVDRPENPPPIKWLTKTCRREDLLSVLATELDKKFYAVEFDDSEESLSIEEFISRSQAKKKHRFLILVSDGDVLKTRLKNRTRRVIFIEVKRGVNTAFISSCHYCDRRYKHNNSLIIPASLCSIHFDYSLDAILNIVNGELNCDFTDVIVTADTFGFNKTRLPICGRI